MPLRLPCGDGLCTTWALEGGAEATRQTLGQEVYACLGQERSSRPAQAKMVPREAPVSLPQETGLTCSVILEARVRKSPHGVLITGLEPLPVVTGPAGRAPHRQGRAARSGTPLRPSALHLQRTHRPPPWPPLLHERATKMLSATTSSSSSSAAVPARPPTSAFQEMATSQRGPENQCVSVEKQLRGACHRSHALTTSRAWSASAPGPRRY